MNRIDRRGDGNIRRAQMSDSIVELFMFVSVFFSFFVILCFRGCHEDSPWLHDQHTHEECFDFFFAAELQIHCSLSPTIEIDIEVECKIYE